MSPKLWILAAILSGFLIYCGSDDDDDDTATSGNSASFTATVDPILEASCSGSTCHSSGASQTHYVGNEANFKAKITTIKERFALDSTNSLHMPPPNNNPENKTITDENKTVLTTWLDENP